MLNRLFGTTQQAQPVISDQQETSQSVVIDMGSDSADYVVTDDGRQLLGTDAKDVDTSLWHAFSESPRPLFEEFKTAFIQGAVLHFLTSMSEDTLKKYGCTPTQINRVTFAIDMLFALYSGSLLSTSAEKASLSAMKYFEYSDYSATLTSQIASTTVSIAQNLSPLGVAKVAVSGGASYVGGRFSLWTKEKITNGITFLTKPKKPEPELQQISIV